MDAKKRSMKLLISGILQLQRARSKRELYSYLKYLLRDVFSHVSFSVLVPSASNGGFSIDYSTCLDVRDLEDPFIVSSVLAEILLAGKTRRFHEGEALTLSLGGLEARVKQVHVMATSARLLGLLVLHEGRVIEGSPILAEGEDFLFNHIFSAIDAVWEKEHVHADLEQSNARLRAITEIGAVMGQLELEVLLAHLIAVFTRLTRAQVGSIVLERRITSDAEWGLHRDTLDKIRVRDGASLRDIAVSTKAPVFVREYAASPEFEPVDEFLVESVLCVPLVSKDAVLGTVNLVNSEQAKDGKFDESDRDLVVTISSLAATAVENGILHRELLEQEHLKANLQIASKIQRGMYPQEALRIPGYDVAWATRSCDETGGDYFDFFEYHLGDERLSLAIGDVSGHGIGAALRMAASRANLRALLSVKDDLREVIERMNDLLSADMKDGSFMTLLLMHLDCERHEISYINAGHDRPLVYSQAESSVRDLASTGCALGMFPGMPSDPEMLFRLHPGDVLLLTTDGIWEAASPAGKPFGKQGLRAELARQAGGSAQQIVDRLFSVVDAFTGGSRPRDDQTVVVLKLLG
jgi:sigma-B regulation protein RsbU (phosphoserine phosphatase)